MMNYQLLVPGLLDRADIYFPHKEIITREGDGVHRYTYRDLKGRVNRLCNALSGLGVGQGRPGGHLRVEHLPASRGVLRPSIHGRGNAHHQHPLIRR